MPENRAARETAPRRPRIVIIGGGFGGLLTARGLAGAAVDVTLVDRRNHHLFQPLLYQVATGGLSPANIAAPLRALVKKQRNTRVLLREVTGLDLERRRVAMDGEHLAYDLLVVATGAGQSYFGHPEWSERAPGLKSLEDATTIRRRVLSAFELAEQEPDVEKRRELLTFVVVGAGPTGVELAGALAEVSKKTLAGEFRHADPTEAQVLLVEGGPRVLAAFSEKLAARATRSLEGLGVEVLTGTLVSEIGEREVELRSGEQRRRLRAGTVLWAAGVQASPLGEMLGEQSRTGTDDQGHVVVEADCSLLGRPEVFAIGDLASFRHGLQRPLPGLAPVAMQQGKYVARLIRRRLVDPSYQPPPFRYVDKGNMAVIGRRMAVADINGLEFSGGFAWLLWLFVHLMYLAEFQNRVLVLIQWGWNYLTRNRSARLITGELPRLDG